MTRDEILRELVTDREYRKACDTISGHNELADDLFMEMCEVMCRLDGVKLSTLHGNGQMKWFAVRVLVNMWRYPSGPFYQRFRKPAKGKLIFDTDNILGIGDLPYDIDSDVLESFKVDTANQVLKDKESSGNRADFYEAMLFQIYLKAGSARKAEKEIKIPYRTIATSVRRTKMIIVEKVKLSAPNKDE
jgi:hypothetical protein